jgi:heme/copper-type cytochrome/quinol oxidase subunit 3
MPLLRLAYSTLYLIALIAVFVAWSQVGGQSHIDLLPWWLKLGLGMTMAFAVVRAAASAVAGERAWNGQTLKWLGLTLALGIVCGLATYYAHTYLEETDESGSEVDSAISSLTEHRRGAGVQWVCDTGFCCRPATSSSMRRSSAC